MKYYPAVQGAGKNISRTVQLYYGVENIQWPGFVLQNLDFDLCRAVNQPPHPLSQDSWQWGSSQVSHRSAVALRSTAEPDWAVG